MQGLCKSAGVQGRRPVAWPRKGHCRNAHKNPAATTEGTVSVWGTPGHGCARVFPSEPPAVEKPGLPGNVRLNDPYLDYSQYTLTPEQALQRRIETGEGPAIPQHQFAPDAPIGKQPNWAQGSPSVKHDPYGISQPPTQELRDRRLQGMWRYGTPDVRQTATEMGYNPKPEDAAWMKAPEGRITDSEYRDIAKAGINEKPKPAPASPDAPYRFKQTAAQKPEEPIKPKDLKKRVAAQLSAEQDALWKKRADAMTQHYLETQGGWKPEAGAARRTSRSR